MKEKKSSFVVETHSFFGEDLLVEITINDRKHQDFASGEVTLAFKSSFFDVITSCAEKYEEYRIFFIAPPNYFSSICVLCHLWIHAWAQKHNDSPVIIVASNRFNIKMPASRQLLANNTIVLTEDSADEKSISKKYQKAGGVIAIEISSSTGPSDATMRRMHQAGIIAGLVEHAKKRKR